MTAGKISWYRAGSGFVSIDGTRNAATSANVRTGHSPSHCVGRAVHRGSTNGGPRGQQRLANPGPSDLHQRGLQTKAHDPNIWEGGTTAPDLPGRMPGIS